MSIALSASELPYGATRASAMSESFSNAPEAWDLLLASQVSIFLDSELAFLNSLPQWQSARNVADVGCGNGNYIAKLAEKFPGKRFTGIEPSPGLLARARIRHADSRVRFLGGAMETLHLDEPFDFVVLRFVVQHLTNPEAFFESVRRACHSTTVVLIIEPNIEHSAAAPPLVRLSELVQNYEMFCRNKKSTRAAISDAGGLAAAWGSNWQVMETRVITSAHCRSCWHGEHLSALLEGWISALSDALGRENCADAQAEANDWLREHGQSIDVALKAWLLDPLVRIT